MQKHCAKNGTAGMSTMAPRMILWIFSKRISCLWCVNAFNSFHSSLKKIKFKDAAVAAELSFPLFVVQAFVVADGGLDLEHFEPRSFAELQSILMQVRHVLHTFTLLKENTFHNFSFSSIDCR